jgi:hypothetical protein
MESRTRWSPWRSVLAAAVLGFADAVGSEERRYVRVSPVVWFAERVPRPGLPSRLWFLSPLTGWRRYVHRN